MSLMVGNTYDIQLTGKTATQGYEQFEEFITLSNSIFQINSVTTNYNVTSGGNVSNPNDMLYADACIWDSDPNSPNYRECLSTGKAGGNPVVTTYTVTILSGAGTQETLTSLLYDFSGSSFHYNADYGSEARFANIIDSTSVGIAKSFSPTTTGVNGNSTLIITLSNTSTGTIAGYNFSDTLPGTPGTMLIASPSNVSTNGCGSPTVTATAGTNQIDFSDGTVAAGSTCTISLSVTIDATGTYTNTTDNLFIDTFDTGNNDNADLTVNTSTTPACISGIELARWEMDPADGTTTPPTYTSISSQVATATADLVPATETQLIDTGTGNPINAWSGTGWVASTGAVPDASTEAYFEFILDTSKLQK